MVGLLKKSPLLWASLGAAWGYYGVKILRTWGYPWEIPAFILIFALLGLTGLFRAAASFPLFPGEFCLKARKALLLGTALSLGFSLGLAARMGVREEPAFGIPQEGLTGIKGILLDDPRMLKGGRGMGTLALEEAAGAAGLRVSARGRVPVFFPEGAIPGLRSFGRGSRVYIEGKPVRGGDGKTGSVFFRAAAVHIMDGPGTADRIRTDLRMILSERFSRENTPGNAGQSWGGLALALLLGIRDNLNPELQDAYQRAGCSHVLALSGMHLAIVSGLIAFLLRRPLGLHAAALLGACFIILYVYLVGVQPSLERAAIMYLLGTLAVLGALPRKPVSLLGMTFLLQILIRPESGDSPSFILSYLALGGILIPGEAIRNLWQGRLPKVFSEPLAASVGAFIATAGVSVFSFGMLRPIGIIAGILVVPLTTIFMIAAMLWLGLGGLFPILAPPVRFVLSGIYGILSRLVNAAGGVPGIGVARPGLILGLSLVSAGILLWVSRRDTKRRIRLAPFG
jgi:competence protein ComEC